MDRRVMMGVTILLSPILDRPATFRKTERLQTLTMILLLRAQLVIDVAVS